MIDPVRQEVIALAHTVVVKVGTNVLAGADARLPGPGVRHEIRCREVAVPLVECARDDPPGLRQAVPGLV